KAISIELNDGDSIISDSQKYREAILKLNLQKEYEEKLLAECNRLTKMQETSPESMVIRNYLDVVLSLPWNTFTKDSISISNAKKILDKDHYGLNDVKERIVELLAVRMLSPDIKGQIICLVGPPGVGKTSIARSLAKAMNRKYARLSLGGVRDEAEIRGHRKTYIGAMPGSIIDCLIHTKSSNPLILLDEIDKLSSDYKGDPSSALLEALDPEQNNTFKDHYIEIPFDLSKVLFVTTANDASQIPAPLLDRMDIIELYSYTYEEKFNIAKKHLISKQLKENG
ncbi:MAG: AAA family ATPase, partial [Oscillospiraceae bacterium]